MPLFSMNIWIVYLRTNHSIKLDIGIIESYDPDNSMRMAADWMDLRNSNQANNWFDKNLCFKMKTACFDISKEF